MKHAVLGLLLAATAHAWGPDGHVIVGRIAETNLTPRAAAAVRELLGTNTLSDTAVVNWADDIRKQRRETYPWHFVDIPVKATGYDFARDCQSHTGCVVEAIGQFRQVLANTETNREARIEALKFLAHFVGDIHMPLHCAERAGDQGGNKVWVRWPGDTKATRLHAAWDVNLPQKNLQDAGLTPLAYADRLAGKVDPAWQAGTAADWAWESHQLAVQIVYEGMPVYGPAVPLSDEYIRTGQKVVEQQLLKAGIRLAWVLNQALR